MAYAPIAQLVEQLPFKETVPGSSPGRRTKVRSDLVRLSEQSALLASRARTPEHVFFSRRKQRGDAQTDTERRRGIESKERSVIASLVGAQMFGEHLCVPERDGARWGRGTFQQKSIRDHCRRESRGREA